MYGVAAKKQGRVDKEWEKGAKDTSKSDAAAAAKAAKSAAKAEVQNLIMIDFGPLACSAPAPASAHAPSPARAWGTRIIPCYRLPLHADASRVRGGEACQRSKLPRATRITSCRPNGVKGSVNMYENWLLLLSLLTSVFPVTSQLCCATSQIRHDGTTSRPHNLIALLTVYLSPLALLLNRRKIDDCTSGCSTSVSHCCTFWQCTI